MKKRLGYNPYESKYNTNQILDRLKQVLKLKTDTELAFEFMVKPNTVSGWRDRNSLDYLRLFSICEKHSLNANHIIFDYSNMNDSEIPANIDVFEVIHKHELRMEAFAAALKEIVPDQIIFELKELVKDDIKNLLKKPDGGNYSPSDYMTAFSKFVNLFLDRIQANYSNEVYKDVFDALFNAVEAVYNDDELSNEVRMRIA